MNCKQRIERVRAMNKMEDFLTATKLNELLHKREVEEKNKNTVLWILAIIGAVAAVAVSLLPTIWKILRMILTMTSTMTSLRTERTRKNKRAGKGLLHRRQPFFSIGKRK